MTTAGSARPPASWAVGLLSDITQTLGTGPTAAVTIPRTFELLHQLVPYDGCALLASLPRGQPWFVLQPAGLEASHSLRVELDRLFALYRAQHSLGAVDLSENTAPSHFQACLAVPLRVLDQVVGVLFVGRAQADGFSRDDEKVLSLVAAQIAAYLTALNAHDQIAPQPADHPWLDELRRNEAELRDFFEHAAIGLHWIGADGTILWANQAELDLLGYTAQEYSGRHIAEFHADQHVIEDILRRLRRNETVHEYEARLRCKDGSIKHVLISSNVLWNGDTFVHTRCITVDITARKRAEEERAELLAREEAARAEAEATSKQLRTSLEALVVAQEELRQQAEVFRLLVGGVQDYAIFLIDSESRVATWSQGAERIKGYTAEEVVGRPYATFFSDEDRADGRPERLLQRARDDGRVEDEGWRVRKDGSRFWADAIVTALYDAEGRLRGYAKVTRDLTERRRQEEGQRFLAEVSHDLASSLEYEATLQRIAQLAVPRLADWCAVDMVDEGGRVQRLAVVHVDPAKVRWAEEIQRRYPPDPDAPYGVPKVLRTGEPELYPEIPDALLEAAARDTEHLRMLRDVGLTSAMVVPLVARGQTLGAISFVTAESGRRYNAADLALAQELGHRAALAIVNAQLYRNVREQMEAHVRLNAEMKQLAEERDTLRRAAEERVGALEELDRLKDEFIAAASHDLKNPITSIRGYAQLLRRRARGTAPDPAQIAQALDVIDHQAAVMTRLVDHLLEAARIQAGAFELRTAPCELGECLETVLARLNPAERECVEIRLPDAPVAGDWEQKRIEQVLANLIGNALKYSPESERVSVVVERRSREVEVTVRDGGMGIAPEELPRLFERYHRTPQAHASALSGTGLGLYICRGIVEAHGGRIWAESAGEGQGATFRFTLPAEPPESGAPGHRREKTAMPDGHTAAPAVLEAGVP